MSPAKTQIVFLFLKFLGNYCILTICYLDLLVVILFNLIKICGIKIFNDMKAILFGSGEFCFDLIDECNISDYYISLFDNIVYFFFTVDSNIYDPLIFCYHNILHLYHDFEIYLSQSMNIRLFSLGGISTRCWIFPISFKKIFMIWDHFK